MAAAVVAAAVVGEVVAVAVGVCVQVPASKFRVHDGNMSS